MKLTVHLRNPQQGHSALIALWQQLRPQLMAGRRIEIEAREERRNDPQNRKLHACIAVLERFTEGDRFFGDRGHDDRQALRWQHVRK